MGRGGQAQAAHYRVLPLDRVGDAMSAIADRSVIGRTVLSVR